MLTAAQTEVVTHLLMIFPNYTKDIIEKTVLHLDSLKEALDQGQLLQRAIELLLDRNVAEQVDADILEEIPVTNTVKEADLAIPDLVDTVVPNIQSADLVVPSSESADIVVTRIEPAEVVFTKTEAGDVVGIKNDYGDVLVTKTEGPKDVFVLEKPRKSSSDNSSENKSSSGRRSVSDTNLLNTWRDQVNRVNERNSATYNEESVIKNSPNISMNNTWSNASVSKDASKNSADEVDGTDVKRLSLNSHGSVSSGSSTTSITVMSRSSTPNFVVSSRSTTPSISSRSASPWTDDDLPDVSHRSNIVGVNERSDTHTKCSVGVTLSNSKTLFSGSHVPSLGNSTNTSSSSSGTDIDNDLPDILPPKRKSVGITYLTHHDNMNNSAKSPVPNKNTIVSKDKETSHGGGGTKIEMLVSNRSSPSHTLTSKCSVAEPVSVKLLGRSESPVQINTKFPAVLKHDQTEVAKTDSSLLDLQNFGVTQKHSIPYKVDLTRKALANRETTPKTKVSVYGVKSSSTPGKCLYSTPEKASTSVKSEAINSGLNPSFANLTSAKQRGMPSANASQLDTKVSFPDSKVSPLILRKSAVGYQVHTDLTGTQKVVTTTNHGLNRPAPAATVTSASVPGHIKVTMYETPTKVAPDIDVQRGHVTDPIHQPLNLTNSKQQAQVKNWTSANLNPATVTSQGPAASKAGTVTIQSQHVITYSDNVAEPHVVIPREQTVVVPAEQTLVLSAPEVTVQTRNEHHIGLAAPASPVPVVDAEEVIDLEQQDIDRLQKTADDQRQEVIANVLSLFPDVEVQFLTDLASQHSGPYAVNNICNVLLESKYPKASAAPEATATVTAPVPTASTSSSSVSSVDFYTDYASVKIPWGEIHQYSYQAVNQLTQDFRWIPTTFIRKVLSYCQHRYAPTHKIVQQIWLDFVKAQTEGAQAKYSGKEVKGTAELGGETRELKFHLLKNRRPGSSPAPNLHPILQQEIAFVANKQEELSREADFKIAVELNEQEYEEMGQMIECGCCYGEYPFEGMIQCYDGHLFCQSCLHQYAKESVFGQGKVNLTCMTDECTSSFPKSQLVIALPSSVLDKYEDRLQEESLNLADMGDLVRCPHCDFAAIMDPGDKVFRCQATSCLRETCRYCKEDWTEHFGKKCEEIEKKDETKLRLEYEEKMTKAKVRCCHRCKAQFTKEDGCNKMTCRCGAKMCYICRKPNINYDHFCRHPRDPGKKCTTCSDCSLWTNADEDDNRAVAEIQKAAEDARKEKGFTEEKLIGAPQEPPAKKQKTK